MLGKAVLCLSTLHFYSVAAQGECTDLRGRLIAHGLHYVPGPDTCTLCVCDNGLPKVCKAVLCSPPQDCRSFRVGSTCCEFICLDDVVKPVDGSEAMNIKLAFGSAAAIMLLTFAVIVYKVRKQKRRRPMHGDDQRSLTSIGYISGSMGYMGGTCETALGAWKPHGNYLPRGEAPPPYDEVMAQCRTDMRMSEVGYHRTFPATVDTLPRDDSVQCSGHGYANVPRPIQQMANPQSCFTAPLLQAVHADAPAMQHHPLPHNPIGFPHTVRLTGSLGAISGRCLVPAPQLERPQNVPGFYTNSHSTLHRTIPRISTAIDTTMLDTSISGFNRTDRSLHNEIRRSFHKPSDNSRHLVDTGRSMPRNLNLASSNDIKAMNIEEAPLHGRSSRTQSDEHVVSAGAAPQPAAATLPLTVDKPSCVCSYSELATTAGGAGGAEAAEGDDDFRNECENCKSATSSNLRWAVSGEARWETEDAEGTQTLQRRAPPPPLAPPNTATLPQPVTKQSRAAMGPPSNWENWFHTIPDSDTESEE